MVYYHIIIIMYLDGNLKMFLQVKVFNFEYKLITSYIDARDSNVRALLELYLMELCRSN